MPAIAELGTEPIMACGLVSRTGVSILDGRPGRSEVLLGPVGLGEFLSLAVVMDQMYRR